MKKILLLAAGLLLSTQAFADQARVVASCGTLPQAYTSGSIRDQVQDVNGNLCTAASVSASIAGFAPGNTGTPISVTTGGVTGTLPSGAVVAAFNTGSTNDAYCKLGAAATTSDILIAPKSWFAFTVGVATQLTCITSTSTTTVNMVGGSGIPTGAGGGGGGSGGGGAVTIADGADVAQGAVADSACATDNGSCTEIALTKRTNQRLTTVNTTLGTPFQAGGSIGNTTFAATQGTSPWVVSLASTTITGTVAATQSGTWNVGTLTTCTPCSTLTTYAGGTLGAMAAYGTSPGAVLAPGVNAFVTNTNANGQAVAASSSPVTLASDKNISATPYPIGATAITASATGTTGATTATLTAKSGKTTYICGYSIRANATAATTVTNTITGVITATLSSIMWIAPLASGIGVDEQIFIPCIPASATNTAIAIVSGAPGSGGTVSSKGWGYKL